MALDSEVPKKRRDFNPYFEQNRLNLLHNFMPSFIPFSFSLNKLCVKLYNVVYLFSI